MFQSVQRIWFRILFVALCVVPTLVVGGWAAAIQTPYYREHCRSGWQRELTATLGVPVAVGSVTRGPAGAIRLHHVRIVDPESAQILGEAGRIELEPLRAGWSVTIGAAQLQQVELRRLVASIHEHALRRSPVTATPIVWRARDVTLLSATNSTTLSNLEGRFAATDEGPQLIVNLTVAGGEPPGAMRLEVLRDRKVEPKCSRWKFETTGPAVPVGLWANVFPELESLGQRCEFAGQAEWTVRNERTSGVLRGQWTQVDLDRWTERLPHKLSGIADLKLDQVRWSNDRLVEARGTIQSAGGVVSRSLLVTAGGEDSLGMQVADRVRKSSDVLWRYQQLAIEFELDDEGLQLHGRCSDQPTGTLLADTRGSLVQDAAGPPVPAVALVRAFAPANEIQVPAGLETDVLLRHLPLPSLVPPESLAKQPKSPKVRLQ